MSTVVGGAEKRPTVIVTVVPGFAVSPGPGVWVRTTPSWDGSVVSMTSTSTLKPELRSVAIASARLKLVTSGTADSFGPFDTKTVIVAPFEASVFAGGSIWTTTPFGSFDSTSRRATAKPAPWSVPAACSYGTPTTGGTAMGFGPCETLIRTVSPLTSRVPAFGNWPVTVPDSLSELIRCTLAFSPRSVSAATASVACWPITPGTVTFGLPLDTRMTTVLPLSMRSPGAGCWS